ncbi:MAG: hypothetical protein R2788_04415 [Saprospiraceae bacterium]
MNEPKGLEQQLPDIEQKQTASIFLSYSHKDEDLKEQLDIHLSALKRAAKSDLEGHYTWYRVGCYHQKKSAEQT